MERKISISLLLFAAFLAGVFIATSGANWVGTSDLAGTTSHAESPPAEADYRLGSSGPSADDFSSAFISVAESVNPAVVQIRAERLVENAFPLSGSPFDNFFQRPDGENQPQASTALGSGVIVRSDGYIVTNHHVIANAEDLTVVLLDGTQVDAEVVGSDAASDLAVIRVEESGLPVVALMDGADVRVGEWVMAFGSPLSDELGNTVTSGIVSAVRRTSSRLSTLNAYASFIQTDAAINPGNSGGPLVNLDGKLVGINSAIFSRTGGSQGIGLAIPVSVVQNVATQLIQNGAVARGGLGVRFGPVSRSLAEALGVPQGAAQITEVVAGSAADRAGIRAGDVVTAIDGRELREFNELRTTIGNRLPGDSVLLTIVGDGQSRDVDIVLGNLSTYNDAPPVAVDVPSAEEPADMSELGFTVTALDSAMSSTSP